MIPAARVWPTDSPHDLHTSSTDDRVLSVRSGTCTVRGNELLGHGGWADSPLALTTAAVVAVSSGDDPVDASAVNRLTRVLDLELAGREITTRSGFEALVAGAHPAVAAGLPGVFAPGNLEYAVYRGRGQALPQTSPVAVAVGTGPPGAGSSSTMAARGT